MSMFLIKFLTDFYDDYVIAYSDGNFVTCHFAKGIALSIFCWKHAIEGLFLLALIDFCFPVPNGHLLVHQNTFSKEETHTVITWPKTQKYSFFS